jgi:hypothetical protein
VITTAPTHIPRIQKSSQFKFVLITSRTSGMHSTNSNSDNSEIGAISEFSECTVGRPLTHRKLQPAVWMESPVVYSEDGWPLLGSTPLGSPMSEILRTPQVVEKASMFGMFAILPDTAYPRKSNGGGSQGSQSNPKLKVRNVCPLRWRL